MLNTTSCAAFDRAFDAPPEQRSQILQHECADDAEMLHRIESMLIAAEGHDPFLREASPPAAGNDNDAATLDPSPAHRKRWLGEQPGTKLGPYKLLQLIGEGGFGSVYMAEQERPVRRRVALKIIKLGMDTKQVIARFEAERQALAMMEHPNIAKVFDAGTTDTGRPYFVMELVRGDPITQYCDTHNLSTTERLTLFQDVCHAVQHAHNKGVIHRDIKPSNVLVTVADGKPIPKVIDFGIAKATNARLTEKTLFTEHRQLIGTPEFMSPEQAEMSGVDIDTRSDVYSLGVLLYVLLTGTTPFSSKSLRDAAFGEMQRMIRETEPPKPSTRLHTMGENLSQVAAHRRIEPEKLARLIRGDLDWIVMRCLEKDRTRRYQSASGLAGDVQRHLNGLEVEAAPPSTAYRVRKFVRRNRKTVIAGSILAATLILGIIGTTMGMMWALREEERASDAMIAARQSAEQESRANAAAQASAVRAENEAERARSEAERAKNAERETASRAVELAQVAQFQAAMLKDVDIALMGDRLREDVLAEIDARIAPAESRAARGRRPPRCAASALADVNFTNPAILGLERNILQRALDAIDRDFADQPLVQARLLHTVADVMQSLARNESAKAPLECALEIRRRLLGPNHVDTLDSTTNLAIALHDSGDAQAAEPYYRAAVDGYQQTLGDNDPQTLTAQSNLAYWLDVQGQAEQAEAMYRQVLETRRRVLGDTHEHTLLSAINLGVLLRQQGKLDEAEPLYREALDGYRQSLGDEHPWTLAAMNNMAFLLNGAEERMKRSRCIARRWPRGAACSATAIATPAIQCTRWRNCCERRNGW